MNSTFKEIPLSEISTNPQNPRSNFLGPKFDELVASVREKGIIEPIIVRPVSGERAKYEIVAGERRFRAASLIAEENAGLDHDRIPVVVRELSDDEAFDFMIIENLQREDLTSFEEAQSFKKYCEKKGKGSVIELAKRIGISQGYIRRKMAALTLPRYVLKSWEKDELTFSHLEQLRRLKDPNQIKEAYKFAMGGGFREGPISKRDLKEQIDKNSPLLKNAVFDLEKAGCNECPQNSDVQQRLWEIKELKEASCLDPKCFKQQQNNWLLANWKDSEYCKKYKTNGFRFSENVNWNEYEAFWGTGPTAKCKKCEYFLTIIEFTGKVRTEKACFGDKSCYRAIERERKKKEQEKQKDSSEEPEGPRVAWHGEYFRERFFEKRIPEKFEQIKPADIKVLRLILISILKSNSDLKKWFIEKTGPHDEKEKEYYSYYWYPDKVLFPIILNIPDSELLLWIKKASLETILQPEFGEKGRRLVSEFIGIDLSKEYAVTQEYLQKKTIKEMLEFGEQSGIFKDKKVQEYLTQTLKKKPGQFSSCKKTELIDLFLKSGIDLVGKVPDEIMKID
jgi:ParB family chromosome partitioning protein